MAEDRTGVVARLDALEAAHKAATPGVWSVYWGDHIGSDVIQVEGGVRMRHEVVTLDDWRDQEDHEHPDDRTRDNPATEQDDAAAIVAEHNSFGDLLAAVRGVLDKHVPWYEINGVRHEHTVNVPCTEFPDCDGDHDADCPGSDGDGHEVPACAECRWSDGDVDGYLLWPCPTVRTVAAALGEA